MLAPEALGSLGRGLLRGGANERPLNSSIRILTESWDFDIMHRRAGGIAVPNPKGGPYGHGDAHKFCEGLSCGFRSRSELSVSNTKSVRSAKITSWRKAKALANRRYLEEEVYGKATKRVGGHPG